MQDQELQLGKQELYEEIRGRIRSSERQAIPFSEYMRLCLYHPLYGYYSTAGTTGAIGREGDFYTSSNIGTVFADTIVHFIIEETRKRLPKGKLRLVEWGGGTGRLAAQIMDRLRQEACSLYDETTLWMVESSTALRAKQQEALASHEALRIIDPCEWDKAAEGEAPDTLTIVYANELLDAFPVRRIRRSKGRIVELFVGWNEAAESFMELELDLGDESVLLYMEKRNIRLLEGQTIEINDGVEAWIQALARGIDGPATAVVIDYGDTTKELTASYRMNGTLLCYYRHQASDEPYIRVGEQDITSHVNFDDVLQAGTAAGFEENEYMSQKKFLMDNGILTMLADHYDPNPFSEVAKRNRSIRQLLLSDGMSELFKVCIMRKKGVFR
ncbi:class I SAM-dependent methyltransferase [Paenibacillus turpanensis]|uniref:class I SAM-dependent methyltransferase n=1 Tax=Paenibacillus turpanensis TaxID=2689078 RepID=UPI0014087DBF|nr:SAM-dependent methyltransferase [Paenibacillus turpanensis]